MGYVFSSVFTNEINDYLKLVIVSGRYVGKIESSLKSLDRYLTSHPSPDKILTESLVRS